MKKLPILAGCTLLVASLSPVSAAERTFIGSAQIDWSNPLNWQGGIPAEEGDSITFTGVKPGNYNTNINDYVVGTSFAGFTFDDGPYTLKGNAIKLSGHVRQTSVSASTIALAMELTGANQEFRAVAGSELIINQLVSGTGSIVKTGDGILQFYGFSNTFSGGVTVEGGTVSVRSGATGRQHFGSGTLNLVNGTLSLTSATTQLTGLAGTANGSVENGGTAARILSIATDTGTHTSFAGTLEDGGSAALGITKTGAGTQVFSGTNTYTGATAVNGGTLIINGSLGNSTVTVSTSGTLGGSAFIAGNTTVTGTLAPGNSSGTLSFGGDLTFGTGGTRTILFEGGDHINVAGTLTLNNGWTLSLQNGFQDGGSAVLFDYGTLENLGSYTLNLTNLGFTPTDPVTLFNDTVNRQIIINGISAIPEPSTLLLTGLVGLGGLWLRRRQRAWQER